MENLAFLLLIISAGINSFHTIKYGNEKEMTFGKLAKATRLIHYSAFIMLLGAATYVLSGHDSRILTVWMIIMVALSAFYSGFSAHHFIHIENAIERARQKQKEES